MWSVLLWWFFAGFPVMVIVGLLRLDPEGGTAKLLTALCFPAVMWTLFWDKILTKKKQRCSCFPDTERDRGCGNCTGCGRE
jgi:hypothetical protein